MLPVIYLVRRPRPASCCTGRRSDRSLARLPRARAPWQVRQVDLKDADNLFYAKSAYVSVVAILLGLYAYIYTVVQNKKGTIRTRGGVQGMPSGLPSVTSPAQSRRRSPA